MKNKIRQRPRTGVLILLLLILALLFLVKLPFLVVSDGHDNTVFMLPITGNKDFSLYYIHSVHKTPVWENFSVGPGDRLVLTSTVFQSLGVGIPFLPGEGQLHFENGQIVLRGLDRSFDVLNLMLTPVAEQTLMYRDKSYYLSDYFKSGDLIRIRAVRTSPGQLMWNRIEQWGGTD
ncbi:MAG: DUF1850 domain-containing protein [Bacillota bacterium]